MKKYIAIATLLAAGSAFANADVSYVGRTEAGNPGKNVWLNTDTAGNAFSLSLSWSGLVDNSEGFIIDSEKDYFLTGLQFSITTGESKEETNQWYPDNLVRSAKIAIYAGDTLVGLSAEALTGAEAKGKTSNDTGYGAMFTFSEVILDADTTYTFKFVEGTSTMENVVYSEDARYGYQLWSKQTGGSQANVGYLGDANYLPWVRLGVMAIPEPSTFGLLAGLGALALVGTRRRRR